MIGKRLNHEPPAVIAKLGWRYHHIGIPHTQPRTQERHVAHLGVHVCGFETSPYGIEWIRFEPHCNVPEIVRTVPHVAFAVDDLDEALKGREILIEPTEPSVGVRVAFVLDDGAPVELLQFDTATAPDSKTYHQAWRTNGEGSLEIHHAGDDTILPHARVIVGLLVRQG